MNCPISNQFGFFSRSLLVSPRRRKQHFIVHSKILKRNNKRKRTSAGLKKSQDFLNQIQKIFRIFSGFSPPQNVPAPHTNTHIQRHDGQILIASLRLNHFNRNDPPSPPKTLAIENVSSVSLESRSQRHKTGDGRLVRFPYCDFVDFKVRTNATIIVTSIW